MSTKNIIIATAVILVLSSLLTSCKLVESTEPESQVLPKKDNIQEIVKKAAVAKKEVKISLEAEQKEGQVTVKITLENPNKKPITSVQSWLSFDPAKLQGEEISTSDSAFELMAPYANDFDNTNGLVMIGRSNSEPITAQTINVAEVTFDLVGDGVTMIDVYDYRDSLTGHTSANAIVDGKPYNILIKPDSPTLVIEN